MKAALTKGPIVKTLADLTLPMMIGLLGLVSFNLIDMFFVGKLGSAELAALSFTFPVVMVIGSLALGVGAGVSAVISGAIGRGDSRKVREIATDSVLLAFLMGLGFVTLGIMSIGPVFRMLGAGSAILPLIKEYMKTWYGGVVFVVVPMIGNNAIRATGDMKTPAVIMLLSVVLNTVLDPLLIFGIGPFPEYGLRGAAIATVIARAVTFIFAMYVLCFRDRMMIISYRPIRKILYSWREILYIGLPTAGTRLIMPLAMAVIIKLVSSYGPEAVAGFGVASRVEFFALVVIVALATVLGPFVGQNWGAGKSVRVVSGIDLSKIFSMAWGFLAFIVLALFARPIAEIFTKDASVMETVTVYLRSVPVGYGLFGVLIISAMTFTVLHKPFHAMALMFFQIFILYLPLAFLGAHFFGVRGIFLALGVSYIGGGVIADISLSRFLRGGILAEGWVKPS